MRVKTIVERKIVNAKKEHVCSLCGDKINIDEKYLYSKLIYQDIYPWREHKICNNLVEKLKMYDNLDYPENGLTQMDFINSIETESNKYPELKNSSIKEKIEFLENK